MRPSDYYSEDDYLSDLSDLHYSGFTESPFSPAENPGYSGYDPDPIPDDTNTIGDVVPQDGWDGEWVYWAEGQRMHREYVEKHGLKDEIPF